MSQPFQKKRVEEMIDLIRKAAAGEFSTRLETSRDPDRLDALAAAVNQLIETLSKVISVLPFGISIFNSEGRCISTNEAMAAILGVEKEQLLTQCYPEIPYWKNSPLLEKARHVVATQTAEQLDVRVVSSSGKERFLHCHLAPFADRGLVFFAQDVTLRKHSEMARLENERLLNNVIEQSPHPIWISDDKGTLVRINKTCCDLLNLKEEEVIGKYNILEDSILEEQGLLPLVQSVYRDGVTVNFVTAYNSAQLSKLELERTTSVVLDVTMSPLKDDAGVITNAVITHRDITEQRQLEKQLLQSQKLEAVGQLAGGVAHDFNNMLSVILGHAELIQLNLPEDHAAAKSASQIERAGLHSRDITRQLLAFSRREIVDPKTIDVNLAITRIVKTLSQLIGENIDLRFIPGEALWKIRFDPTQLDQIMINLAVNARDAIAGFGRLTIETANTHLDAHYCGSHVALDPGYYVKIIMSDNGAGMDAETVAHIFEPFFTTKEQGKGTGLGLSTVYGIVQQNGGVIHVYSEVGKGTTFCIYIPRMIEDEGTEAKPEETPPYSHSGTILLVEDDDMVRTMTTALLDKLGYTVVVAGSPAEALAICKNEEPVIDLLLTDVVMPRMNGSELNARIQALRPGTKVLFMSGYTETVIVSQGVLKDGVHFIQKPFGLAMLEQKVREALGR